MMAHTQAYINFIDLLTLTIQFDYKTDLRVSHVTGNLRADFLPYVIDFLK